jgi:hypothetical protein
MAGYGFGAANNGFGRRSLHQWEARLLHMSGYPTPLIKLEDSSGDEWYRPTLSPPRLGNPGQGSSHWAPGQSSQQAPPPQDSGDSSDDDDDDYTAFYRHFGM